MKTHLILFLTCIVTCAVAQSDSQNKKVITDAEPVYPKGDLQLYLDVSNNIKYSEAALSVNLRGEVLVSFDVKADSTVSNVIIISGVGNGVDEEIKKYIEKVKFCPGVQNGRPVRMNTMYTLPVTAHR
ncbi:MAG: TonB family protein [Bacteroidetes bacterium]|jgi:protein TonB|nr:TonB family protein [Bacteroidota bacterium]